MVSLFKYHHDHDLTCTTPFWHLLQCCTVCDDDHCLLTQAKGNKGSGGSIASKAKKGGNPLSGVSNPLSGGGSPKQAGKSIANKASKTASKAGAKASHPT